MSKEKFTAPGRKEEDLGGRNIEGIGGKDKFNKRAEEYREVENRKSSGRSSLERLLTASAKDATVLASIHNT